MIWPILDKYDVCCQLKFLNFWWWFGKPKFYFSQRSQYVPQNSEFLLELIQNNERYSKFLMLTVVTLKRTKK